MCGTSLFLTMGMFIDMSLCLSLLNISCTFVDMHYSDLLWLLLFYDSLLFAVPLSAPLPVLAQP